MKTLVALVLATSITASSNIARYFEQIAPDKFWMYTCYDNDNDGYCDLYTKQGVQYIGTHKGKPRYRVFPPIEYGKDFNKDGRVDCSERVIDPKMDGLNGNEIPCLKYYRYELPL